MNEEELVATLQACYFGDRGAFNKILKEYKNLQTENQQLKEKIILLQASEPMLELTKYYGERDKLKSTLEEIRVYIEDSAYQMSEDATYDLLQIIDKGVSND